MIKIRAFSDWHWVDFLKKIRKDESCDLLLLCGDAAIHENKDHFRDWGYGKVIKSKFPKAHIIMVPGNHDNLLPGEKFEGIDEVLINQETTWNGLRIYGCPYWESRDPEAINPIARNYMLSDPEKAKACMEMIPEGLDILMTHTPPKHILDASHCMVDGDFHLGSKALYDRLWKLSTKEKEPKFHFFGHIHMQGGTMTTDVLGNTIFMNVAVLDENYNQTNPTHGGLYIEE